MSRPTARATEAETTDLVIVVAGTSWDGMWVSERHVAMQLAARARVLWVDPPISALYGLRHPSAVPSRAGVRQVARNIWRLTPITVPGVSRPILRDVATWHARRLVRAAAAGLGGRVHATLVATLNDMLDVVPGSRRVFYATDDYVAGAELMGLSAGWMRNIESRQLEKADVVIAVSPELREKWSGRHGHIVVVANGCDAERFAMTDQARAPADVRLPPPIAGYVGLMSERIDLRALERTADAGVSLLLVGPRQSTFDMARMEALLARPNVQWVGGKSFEAVPAYLRIIDVGLTPYTRSAFNRASVPLKTIEYLAAGRPVVATDLPAHRALRTPHVAIARTAEEFAELTSAALAAGSRPHDVAARRAFAQRHSWQQRALEIARAIGLGGGAEAPGARPDGTQR